MKNRGHFLAFTKEWFQQNQRVLLWLLNAPIIKSWFRWVLRIHKDVPSNQKIHELGPNRISYNRSLVKVAGKWRIQQTTDFRTHPKFGKRLYYAFRPLWWAIHAWDWLIADRFVPAWSYGFSTLTAYPDPDVEVSTVDGVVGTAGLDASFATVRNTATGSGAVTSDAGSSGNVYSVIASATSGQYAGIVRSIFLFDTSGLTSSATISNAVFSVYGDSVTADDLTGGASTNSKIVLCSSAPASNTALANADYSSLGTTHYGDSAIFNSLNTAAYNDITLNASGLAAISKTSITKFGCRSGWDIDNTTTGLTWHGSGQTRFGIFFADQTGTANDPKLVVTYSTSTAWTKDLPETLTITDSLLKSTIRNLSETLTITDVLEKGKVFLSTLTESFSISDVLLKLPKRILTETITITDTLLKMGTKVFSETLTITDTILRTIQRVFTETLTITDVIRKVLNGSATLWTDRIKPLTTFTKRTKPTTTFTKRTKPSTTWTPRSKP